MKNNATVPALSSEGWVNTPMQTADILFSHLFLSDYSQTYLYYPNVSSLAYLLFKNQKNIEDLITEMTKLIERYFSNYFETVNVEIVDATGDSTTGNITIYLELIQDGEIVTLNKLLEYTDSKIKRIVDYSNG